LRIWWLAGPARAAGETPVSTARAAARCSKLKLWDKMTRFEPFAGIRFRTAMTDASQESENSRRHVSLVFQRVEQPAVILLLCVSWLLIGLFFVRLGRAKQGVIDIDLLPTQKAELRVDVNTAAWVEFASLPGVGEVLGRSIVDYRKEHGSFRSIDDIKLVPGIGERRYAQLRPFLVISQSDNK
jgi:competence ComEA-like helix-hairpin-helix protein